MNEQNYFLKPGYRSRPQPEYFVDENLDAVWQPDVYPEAAALGRRLGARKIVDVGCGTAGKLVELHPEFEIVGVDFGPNIETCRERYDFGTWIETDLDREDSLGFSEVAGGVLVCADVIEHLVHPERLLKLLRGALDQGAAALLLSTPERELYNEPGHLGPPPNTAHVREWAIDELEEFMASEGLEGSFGLTRSNDVMPYMQTILAVVPAEDPEQRRLVAEWWEDRSKWEKLAVEQDRLLAEKERVIAEMQDWVAELQRGKDWLEEQRVSWQESSDRAHRRIAELEGADRNPDSTA